MRRLLYMSIFLLIATICQGKSCCNFKLNAMNKSALSLKASCDTIKDTVDTIVASCCNLSARISRVACACASTSITGGESPIILSTSGIYCLDAVLITTDINCGEGVVLDLNSHTVRNVFGGDNFTVKNGTILNQLAGLENIVAYRVQVPRVTAASGQSSNIMLIDVTGIEYLEQIKHLLMVRCSDGEAGSSLSAGVEDVVIYDSSFKNELLLGQDLVTLVGLNIYQSSLLGGVSVPTDMGFTASAPEVLVYKSTLDHLYLTSPGNFSIRMVIEASDVGDMELGSMIAGRMNFSGLITRSIMNNALCKQCSGITFSQSQARGEISFDGCENIECDNVSVNHDDRSCFIVDGGRSIVLRDCFAATRSVGIADAGYSFNETTTALEVLSCCAKGCPVGFYVNNPTDGFIGVLKECLADGCTQSSFKFSNAQANLFPYGNIAISVAGAPATNYDALALTSFNPVITPLTAIETDTVTSWRNISFDLP